MTRPKTRYRNRRRILAGDKPSTNAPPTAANQGPIPIPANDGGEMQSVSEDPSQQPAAGSGRDPRTGRFTKGFSGNTRGRPKRERLSKEVFITKLREAMTESILELMRSPITELVPNDDDTAAMAYLKMNIRDAIAKDGPARKRLNEWFLANFMKADQAERKDERSDEVVDLVALAELILDPRLDAKDLERRANEIFEERDAQVRARNAKIKI